ncbi:MAG: hypothetical protein EA398_06600 [Deltaproteobacteria bacterium]|nr:MAG: hypothetical protein EA398_06600 [Deltaproteobacteria bacterium]
MNRITPLALLTLALVLTLPAVASAQDVFLNGIQIGPGSLTDTTLDRIEEVQFDEDGNVHIIARVQLQVDGAPESRNAAAMARVLQGQFFLVVQNPNASTHRYTTRIEINGHQVAEVPAGQTVFTDEVTQWLQLGRNDVIIRFERDGAASGNEGDNLMVVIGRGEQQDGRLMVRRRFATASVTGAATSPRETHDETFTLERQ